MIDGARVHRIQRPRSTTDDLVPDGLRRRHARSDGMHGLNSRAVLDPDDAR